MNPGVNLVFSLQDEVFICVLSNEKAKLLFVYKCFISDVNCNKEWQDTDIAVMSRILLKGITAKSNKFRI